MRALEAYDAESEDVRPAESAARFRALPFRERLRIVEQFIASERMLERQAVDMIVRDLRDGVPAGTALLWFDARSSTVREYATLAAFRADYPQETLHALRRLDDGSSSLYARGPRDRGDR